MPYRKFWKALEMTWEGKPLKSRIRTKKVRKGSLEEEKVDYCTNLCSPYGSMQWYKHIKITLSRSLWHTSVVHATWKAEAGRQLEPRSQRQVRAKEQETVSKKNTYIQCRRTEAQSTKSPIVSAWRIWLSFDTLEPALQIRCYLWQNRFIIQDWECKCK